MKETSTKGSVIHKQGWAKVHNFVKHVILLNILLHGYLEQSVKLLLAHDSILLLVVFLLNLGFMFYFQRVAEFQYPCKKKNSTGSVPLAVNFKC